MTASLCSGEWETCEISTIVVVPASIMASAVASTAAGAWATADAPDTDAAAAPATSPAPALSTRRREGDAASGKASQQFSSTLVCLLFLLVMIFLPRGLLVLCVVYLIVRASSWS